MIAGLEKPDSGRILLNGEDITKLPAYKRDINTVFSSFALFPHYTVRENIEFGLNYKNISTSEKDRLVNETIEFFELAPCLPKNINELNKLSKYKIALARALINNPQILLLDDSLKLLDRKDRLRMRFELKNLQRKLSSTFIYITDDLSNAFSLGDRIALMQHGTVHQCSSPRAIYENPETYFVANYVGDMNFFYANIVGKSEGHYLVELDNKLKINLTALREYDPERELFYAIRPERITISAVPSNDPLQNSFEGKIVQKTYAGEYRYYFVELKSGKLVVAAELNYDFLSSGVPITFFEVGEDVYINWSIMSGDLIYA